MKIVKEKLKEMTDPTDIERFYAVIRKYTQRKLYLEAEVKLNMGDLKTSKEWLEIED